MLDALVYLTLLETTLLEKVEMQNEHLDYFTVNIEYFCSVSICVVSDIDKTGKRYFKIDSQLKNTYLWVVDLLFLLVTVTIVIVRIVRCY